jgi:hypothetical protein
MTSFLQQIFSRSLSTTGKAPSFNDFSMCVADDGTTPSLSETAQSHGGVERILVPLSTRADRLCQLRSAVHVRVIGRAAENELEPCS